MDSNTIQSAWNSIAPFWPVQNLVAVNPLRGFEDLKFETAIQKAQLLFQQSDLPAPMMEANRITIKWCQILMDQGQARIAIASKRHLLFDTWKEVAIWDTELTRNCKELRTWLSLTPSQLIETHLNELNIPSSQWKDFLTLILTTLPGWAAHIQYLSDWDPRGHHDSRSDYLALRLTIIRAVWSSPETIRSWMNEAMGRLPDSTKTLNRIEDAEAVYQRQLIKLLEDGQNADPVSITPEVQVAFCIDVRSEPIRRHLESLGPYQTFGVAGFFGVPVQISDHLSLETFSSCPVLLQPEHRVHDRRSADTLWQSGLKAAHSLQWGTRYLYRTLKYTFTVPFALVEIVGGVLGIGMATRTLLPTIVGIFHPTKISTPDALTSHLDIDHSIPFSDQLRYAEAILKTIGLTRYFAPLVVLCGHGSATQNNAYATALDCGACGGRHGDRNARILAHILNSSSIRNALRATGITIPESTVFVGAFHNTTTDEIQLQWDSEIPKEARFQSILSQFNQNLSKACDLNTKWRMAELGYTVSDSKSATLAKKLSLDWAQVRPEWGLARNASIIVANRSLTQNASLDGRSFLHSYDWETDGDGTILAGILNAPVVVAQWINSHYLFGSLDPIAFGGGSKVTQNVTGKHSIMQGNGSDLMTGLPYQSLYKKQGIPYHDPVRLTVVIQAPLTRVLTTIKECPTALQYVRNGWIHLIVVDPESRKISKEVVF